MHGVIDTNVLIYDTFEDTEFHKRAEEVLESLDRWYVPAIVTQEYVWFFKNNGFSAGEALEALRGYAEDPRFKGLSEDPGIIEGALNFVVAEGLSLSRFNDAVILLHALERGTLVTFDAKLRKLAKRKGVNVLPDEL
ncbi:PIN domain-containing protein [Thermococcus sp. JdF3]|uniref:PIN domain-containing protein n=1 Tax=Thermococcus sp. JdF3 TaxID=1638258 RepID=UPI00143C366E|nr:PIN domain-containing protein [Thermococcus sp. JdF3]NJE00800.1 PIN domain-containing protein [Thermococcus sp. JdF3]